MTTAPRPISLPTSLPSSLPTSSGGHDDNLINPDASPRSPQPLPPPQPPPPRSHDWLTLRYLRLKLVAVALRSLISPLLWFATAFRPRTVTVKPASASASASVERDGRDEGDALDGHHGVVAPSVPAIGDSAGRRRRTTGRVRFSKWSVASRDTGRSIAVHVYEPEGLLDRARSTSDGGRNKVPVHINWHGSGFVIPSLGGDVHFCAFLAHELQCVVYDADYRKAPEYPFPAGLEDVIDTTLHVLSDPEGVFDVSRVSIGGFSAGANLALSASWQLGPERVCAVTAFYPPTNFSPEAHVVRPSAPPHPPTGQPTSTGAKLVKPKVVMRSPPKPGKGALPASMLRFFFRSYLTEGTDLRDPRLSLVRAPAHLFPRSVYVCCGDGDTLFREARSFVSLLANADDVSVPGGGGGEWADQNAARDGHGDSSSSSTPYPAPHPPQPPRPLPPGRLDARFEHVQDQGHAFDKLAREGSAAAFWRDRTYLQAVRAVRRGWAKRLEEEEARRRVDPTRRRPQDGLGQGDGDRAAMNEGNGGGDGDGDAQRPGDAAARPADESVGTRRRRAGNDNALKL